MIKKEDVQKNFTVIPTGYENYIDAEIEKNYRPDVDYFTVDIPSEWDKRYYAAIKNAYEQNGWEVEINYKGVMDSGDWFTFK